MFKKLFALALVSALGLGVSAAQAQGFDHRDRGFHDRGFHHTARHGEFRHGHHVRHHHRHFRHNDFRGHR